MAIDAVFLVTIIVGAAVIWIAARTAAGWQLARLAAEEERPEADQAWPAGFWIRAAARISDQLPMQVAFVIGLFLAALLEAAGFVSGWVWAACLGLPSMIFLVYFTVLTARGGQTWGKRLAGVRVERAKGGPVGWGRSLARAVVDQVFGALRVIAVGLLDPLWLAASRSKRALHDRLAGSQVSTVARPSRALPWTATLGYLGPVLLVFLFVRPFALQAFSIPSQTMEPALRTGDRILVNKLAYRVRDVRRGGIIVFDAPRAAFAPEGQSTVFVKRVVGVPGDRLQIRAGDGVYVNGERLDPHPMATPEYDWPVDQLGVPTGEPYVVPPESYFVLGDNCNVSNDSHAWRDPDTGEAAPELPGELILGRVSVRYWPPERIGEVR